MSQSRLRYIIFIFLFIQSIVGWGQQSQSYNGLIDFNRQLNFYYFEQLRAYIISNGDRKTYCPNYTDNPHYKAEDLSVEIYLNPTNKDGREPFANDYNVMYIVEEQAGKLMHYYLYLTPQRDVFLYDYDQQFIDADKRAMALKQLDNIIKKMLDRAGISK